MLGFQDPLGLLPPKASTFVPDVDGVYYLTLIICGFFLFLITGLLLYSVIKWRRKTPQQPAASSITHNTTLEVVWTVIPLVIMMVLFAWGWKGALDMTVADAGCLQYNVHAHQWAWEIYHPDEEDPAPEMWVPVNTKVKVTTYSSDVLHSFYIPAFRVKRDVLPGRMQVMWFEATKLSRNPKTGEDLGFPIMCAEYCGRNHSYMLSRVHVVTQEEYDKKPWRKHPEDPVEWGEWIYRKKAHCDACHSIDGSVVVGPSFKGIWGTEAVLEGGEKVPVDRDYVAESIRQPEAKRVAGFEDKHMTPFELKDEEIDAIVAFLKTLK